MSRGRWILAGLLLSLALGNIGFFAYAKSNPRQDLLEPAGAVSEQVLLARAIGPSRIVVGTRDNKLIVLNRGVEEFRASFDSSLRGMAASSDHIIAGGSDGSILVYDLALRPVAETSVAGQVSAIVATGDGGAIVAHGPGGYANRATLTIFPDVLEAASLEFDVPFNITALAVDTDTMYIGTLNSRLQARSMQDGSELWITTLSQPVTTVSISPTAQDVLVGDDNGGVVSVSKTGEAGNRVLLGTSAMRAAGFDPETNIWVAGDSSGSIFAISDDSRLLYHSQVAQRDIALVASTSDGQLVIVPREGAWQMMNAGAIDASRSADRLALLWRGFNLIGGLAVVIASMLQSGRISQQLHSLRRSIWKSRLAYAFMLPSVVLVAVFTYYPTVMSVYYSFTNFSLRNETQIVGLQNYVTIIRDDFYFRTGIVNMLIMTAAGIVKTLTTPLLAAELVYWLRNTRHQYVYRTLFVLPAVVPDLVFALLWKQVYDPNTGLLNQILRVIGLEQLQRGWLGNDSTALWAIIWVGFPFISAFAFLIYLGGLLNINPDYFDASKIDGANLFSRFRNIDVPLLVPQFRIMLFFAFSGTVQGFASIFILTGGGPGYATYVPALQMFLRISDGDFGYASAIGVILFLMVCVATYFVLHFRKQSIEDA